MRHDGVQDPWGWVSIHKGSISPFPSEVEEKDGGQTVEGGYAHLEVART